MHAVCTKLGVFEVGQSNGVLQIYPWLTLVAMATNHRYLNTKLAITWLVWEIRPPIPAPSRLLSGSANLTVREKFVPDQPPLQRQRKFEKFDRKLAITRLVWETRPPFVHLVWVIGVGEFNCAREICASRNCHGNENVKILTQNWL